MNNKLDVEEREYRENHKEEVKKETDFNFNVYLAIVFSLIQDFLFIFYQINKKGSENVSFPEGLYVCFIGIPVLIWCLINSIQGIKKSRILGIICLITTIVPIIASIFFSIK